jgi:hypothetical protein
MTLDAEHEGHSTQQRRQKSSTRTPPDPTQLRLCRAAVFEEQHEQREHGTMANTTPPNHTSHGSFHAAALQQITDAEATSLAALPPLPSHPSSPWHVLILNGPGAQALTPHAEKSAQHIKEARNKIIRCAAWARQFFDGWQDALFEQEELAKKQACPSIATMRWFVWMLERPLDEMKQIVDEAKKMEEQEVQLYKAGRI